MSHYKSEDFINIHHSKLLNYKTKSYEVKGVLAGESGFSANSELNEMMHTIDDIHNATIKIFKDLNNITNKKEAIPLLNKEKKILETHLNSLEGIDYPIEGIQQNFSSQIQDNLFYAMMTRTQELANEARRNLYANALIVINKDSGLFIIYDAFMNFMNSIIYRDKKETTERAISGRFELFLRAIDNVILKIDNIIGYIEYPESFSIKSYKTTEIVTATTDYVIDKYNRAGKEVMADQEVSDMMTLIKNLRVTLEEMTNNKLIKSKKSVEDIIEQISKTDFMPKSIGFTEIEIDTMYGLAEDDASTLQKDLMKMLSGEYIYMLSDANIFGNLESVNGVLPYYHLIIAFIAMFENDEFNFNESIDNALKPLIDLHERIEEEINDRIR